MSEIVDLLRNAWKSGDAANLENLFPDSLIYLDDLGWSHIGSHAIATDLAQYFSFLREPYKS